MNEPPTPRLRGAPLILTINGGSSSIKFALFEAGGIGENAATVRARICAGPD